MILLFVMLLLFVFNLVSCSIDIFTDKTLISYQSYGEYSLRFLSDEKLPITLRDFGYQPIQQHDSYADIEKTFLAESYQYSETDLDGWGKEINSFSYDIFYSRYPWIIEQYLILEKQIKDFSLIDDANWQADRVYYQMTDENSREYIAIYNHQVLSLKIDKEPRPDEIRKFVETLKPER